MLLFRKNRSGAARPRRPSRPPVPAIEWAEDVSGKCARVTAVGSRRLLVENHTGILDFSDTVVSLNTGCGPMSVCGCGLSLSDVRRNTLMILGEIRQVQLPSGGGPADEG